uniref:Uncharacterized protein n=1 Tax=Podoviridae sp. ctrub15 TaxID=2826581 RepID=A0A8S5LUQ6_9CAUD|nr:MAG TPA: hypothetical protein [Podoviridae sp. ctrub15]
MVGLIKTSQNNYLTKGFFCIKSLTLMRLFLFLSLFEPQSLKKWEQLSQVDI